MKIKLNKNLIPITLDEDKKLGLEILQYFDNFCQEHNLKYFIAYGTLLGAVRHKGFIPWDDDIDIWMLREDYDKLIALNGKIDSTKYKLNAIETEKRFLFTFAKLSNRQTIVCPSRFMNGYLYGVSIDIFPLDYFGNSNDIEKVKSEFHEVSAKAYDKIKKYCGYTYGARPYSVKYSIKKFLFTFNKFLNNDLVTAFKRYARVLTGRYDQSAFFVTTLVEKEVYRKEWFASQITLQFEGLKVKAPVAFDNILTQRYGDYMQFPPEKERVPHVVETYYIK